MLQPRHAILCLMAALLTAAFAACQHTGGTGADVRQQRIDQLNHQAYQWRYRNIDSLRAYGLQALTEARRAGMNDAAAEATNNLMYERFQQMDFDSALVMASQVRRLTANQIELLIADVMCMKIAQRVSDNRAFFTHRMHAERRLNRIAEEEDLLTDRQLARLNFARGEFFIVSATYFYYVDQHERALAEIDMAEPYCQLNADTAQWLYFCYMKGSGEMTDAPTPEQITRGEFDYLFKCYTFAKNNGYRFFQANALQSLAVMLNDSVQLSTIGAYKPDAFEYLASQFADGPLPEQMAATAFELFSAYRDRFQSACALRTMGELSFTAGDAMQAISYYKQALLILEGQHLPEWVAGFHQHMSLAYSALDDRASSNLHRNAYLDQLAVTQRDAEQENRYDELKQANRRLERALVGLIMLAVGMGLLFAYLRRRMRRKARAQEWLLSQVLQLAEGRLPEQHLAATLTSEAEANHAGPAERQALQALTALYSAFITTSDRHLQDLADEREQLEEQDYAARLRIVSGKRQNVEKRAKLQLVYAIVPFLDRVIGEVARMERSGQPSVPSLQYVCELIDKIDEYNQILTQWIQMHAGQLSLRVTTFPLAQLFGLLRQSHYAFDQKHVSLELAYTDAVVKADRALTLFMLNTLADNARKFTPAGGRVLISAATGSSAEGDYVEVSVTDTGAGLSQAEIDTIVNSKVFDASRLGTAAQPSAEGKGFGFGLMNCKGIIEKYRKTGSLFAVCRLGVESRVGQGSRFFFRLPRALAVLLMALLPAAGMQAQRAEAYRLMDSVYFANVDHEYARALAFADSVGLLIDAHSAALGSDTALVLGLHNEIAVAALGLHDWPLYREHNRRYTHLFKLYNQDPSIEAYCQSLERTQANRRVAVGIIILLLLGAVVAAYFLYFRPQLLFRLDISQLLRLNQRLLDLATHSDAGSDTFSRQLLAESLAGINGIHYVKEVRLAPDGSLLFDYADEHPTRNQRTLDRLLSRYVYLIQNERVARQERLAEDLELAEDEHRRSLYEESQLHVQNQIMDNCLSSIKHESMYYPSRIRLLAEKLQANPDPDTLATLSETVAYYKQIYTLLSEQAREQSGAIAFRRQVVDVSELVQQAQQHFRSRRRAAADAGSSAPVLLEADVPQGIAVRGDADLLAYLLECMLDEAERAALGADAEPSEAERKPLRLTATADGRFVRFALHNPAVTLTAEALHDLFSPRPDGIPYLLCKQIIREHDTFLGHPGCRINAEALPEGGHQVWFTMPLAPTPA